MNIYIYGTDKFSNKIYKILDHGNIKFKIEDGVIEKINNPQRFKELVIEDPTQIFLIDDNMILYDDFISKKLKFLQPKNGISYKFLEDYGIGDINDRKEDDLVKYIEKRLEALDKLKPKIKAEELTSIEQMFEQYD